LFGHDATERACTWYAIENKEGRVVGPRERGKKKGVKGRGKRWRRRTVLKEKRRVFINKKNTTFG